MAEFIYDEDVALTYDAAVPVLPGEVEFYLELAREAGSEGLRTLELACGTGRITIPLAREGARILGIDISRAMLARAREKSAGLEDIEWAEADMRSFDLQESFGLIIIPAGSFQLLLETEDQLSCLRCVQRHLAPSGRFVLTLGNPDIVAMAEWLSSKRRVLQRNPARDYRHPVTGRQVLAWDDVELHTAKQRSIGRRVIDEVDDDGKVVSRSYGRPFETRYFHRFETEHLLARCGLEVEALYGDFQKSAYRGSSQGMVWVVRRLE